MTFPCPIRYAVVGLVMLPAGMARADDSTDNAERAADVLRQHCAACHTGPKARGGVTILDRAALLSSGVVVNNNREKSELWQLAACGTMPPGDRPKLAPEDIAVLGKWIDGGAPVMIDTLLGQVKLGTTHWATVPKPSRAKRAMVGMMPSLRAASK